MKRLVALICSLTISGAAFAQAFKQDGPATPEDQVVVIKTNMGVMKAKIFTSIVPESAKNFLDLVKQGKYTGSLGHRVIKDFMIQGGDFTNRNGTGGHSAAGPGTTIADQYDGRLHHIRGALSWAKTSAPRSIGSQFFIVHNRAGTPFLDHQPGSGSSDGYSVFGQLIDGYDVLDKIATAPVGASDRPTSPMTIESISLQ